MYFKIFENCVDFVCQPASQSAIRPSCARCNYKALKTTQSRLLCQIYKTVVLKIYIFLQRHDNFFAIPYMYVTVHAKTSLVCTKI